MTITQNNLEDILEKHKKWLNGEEGGERANLAGEDLSGACLTRTNLSDADLRGVPVIKNIHQTVYEAASKEGALDMDSWHTCETTHCREEVLADMKRLAEQEAA